MAGLVGGTQLVEQPGPEEKTLSKANYNTFKDSEIGAGQSDNSPECT